MWRTSVASLAVFLALVVLVPLALAQGTYTQIDVPGALVTWAYGINTAGDIAGGYYDSSNRGHGFLLSGGVYTTIDYPGSLSSTANGINDVGQLVGSYVKTNGSGGFIYDISTQTFTNLVFPGSLGLDR